ncbi:MAG: 2-oxoacid:acceptor oxidoreductase family protein [Planctomycetota bacterium]|nr:2-oxoacid:acceptor oxidoreductase family protein [Planctomycetota bacterium]
MTASVTNIVVAGLGGQGVLTCADILARAAFLAGLDVKKAEVHGMSQRGGSVACDVRFGPRVLSPMVPDGQADFLLVLAADQVDVFRWRLRGGGELIVPGDIDESALPNKKSLNVAMLGRLSGRLGGIGGEYWPEALRQVLPGKIHEVNLQALAIGRDGARTR